jgi:hypothetical protein
LTNKFREGLLTWLEKKRLASWIIFSSTILVVLISVTTVIFPTLVLRSFGGIAEYSGISPFEIGILAYPVLIIDAIIFGIMILYIKNKLPQLLTNSIRFIFNFEVSTRIAFLIILIILGGYVTFTISELSTPERWPDYYLGIKPMIEKWTITDSDSKYVTDFLLSASLHIFGNDKVIPFIASIAMLLVTYLLTTEITKKRFAGILSMVIVLQSGIFLIYDKSAAYPNFWVLFYILSLYLCYKKWPISSITFILSLLSKQISILFLPMIFFFTYDSNMPKQKKILIIAMYGAITFLGIVITLVGSEISFLTNTELVNEFQPHKFWQAFNAISYQLRFDGLIWILLLPLTIGLGIASRKKIVHANSILFLIMGAILSQPFLAAFTVMSSEPYRFMPLIIFCAVGVGVMFSKKTNQQV